MVSKKNGFFRFLWSIIPGAGEMYMGFMKQGVTLMAVFAGIIAVAIAMNMVFFFFPLPIIWFYSFFHVHNLASMSDEDFYAQEDNPLFDWKDYKFLSNVDRAKGQKIAAWVLIVIGAIMLWNLAVDIVWDFLRILNFPWRLWNQITYCVPQLVVSLLMIYFGVYLIRGKQKELDLQMEKEEAKGDENHDA